MWEGGRDEVARPPASRMKRCRAMPEVKAAGTGSWAGLGGGTGGRQGWGGLGRGLFPAIGCFPGSCLPRGPMQLEGRVWDCGVDGVRLPDTGVVPPSPCSPPRSQ